MSTLHTTASALLRSAQEIADLADELSMKYFHTDSAEGPKSSVTVDSVINIELSRRVRNEYPTSTFIGEEGSVIAEWNSVWYVDPIDHTRNYMRGMSLWATLITCVIDGVTTLALVSAPAMGKRWWAIKGLGAFRDGQVVHVSQRNEVADSFISIHNYNTLSRQQILDGYINVSHRVASTLGLGNFWAHMLVAEGQIEAAISAGGRDWDCLGLSLIVREAGGSSDTRLIDTADHQLLISSNGGAMHEVMLEPVMHLRRR